MNENVSFLFISEILKADGLSENRCNPYALVDSLFRLLLRPTSEKCNAFTKQCIPNI